MKKSIGIIVISLILCGIFMIDANAQIVNIPFDYEFTPTVVRVKADNGVVSVEGLNSGAIKTTSLADGQTEIIKHICYEDIYWLQYIDNQFIAFSENYMLISNDGYNWETVEDKKINDARPYHDEYGVVSPNNLPYIEELSDYEPNFQIINSTYENDNGKTVYVKIIYTGMEYFKFEDITYHGEYVGENFRSPGDFDRTIYRSSDRQNWEYIGTWESNYKKYESGENSYIIPFPGTQYDNDIQIINTGMEYLVRSKIYDWRVYTHDYSNPILVYDYSLNHIATIESGGKLKDMSYIDDTYFYTTDENVTYKSTDLKNWEVVGENLGCPMQNSITTLFKSRIELNSSGYLHLVNYEGPITGENLYPDKDVLVEGIMPFGTRQYGDFFVCFNNFRDSTKNYIKKENTLGLDGNILNIYRESSIYDSPQISFSKDGIYWATLQIPWEVYSINSTSEGIVIESRENSDTIGLISIKYSDMEQVVPQSDIYVELNNRILGFAQPPVMEYDRTLVPMRFLFEQMGAEVEWDDNTQTATATVPASTEQQIATFSLETENSVTFSIDNLNATVNGELETMDVPARLINDQTFVPLRFLSENLGYNVEWDEETNTAIITTE